MENANEKAGKVIQNVDAFIENRIIENVPYEAIVDYVTKVIKQQKKVQQKIIKKKKTEEDKQTREIANQTPVTIRMKPLSFERMDIYNRIMELYPEIEDKPYGVAIKDNEDENKYYVVFPNKKYVEIPLKFLKVKSIEEDGNNEIKNAVSYYERMKKSNHPIDPHLIIMVMKYKNKKYPNSIDEKDKELYQQALNELKATDETKKDDNWFKKIFKR